MNLTILFKKDSKLAPLSQSDANVVRELAVGNTVKEIAVKHNRSEHTINQQRRMAYEKTGCRNAADITRWVVSRYSGKREDVIINLINDSLFIVAIIGLIIISSIPRYQQEISATISSIFGM